MAEIKTVSEQELEIAFLGPAMAANQFYVTVSASAVRIAFAEQSGPDKAPHFRTAAILSIRDGIGLRDLLSEMLKDAEAAVEKAKSAQEAQKPDG